MKLRYHCKRADVQCCTCRDALSLYQADTWQYHSLKNKIVDVEGEDGYEHCIPFTKKSSPNTSWACYKSNGSHVRASNPTSSRSFGTPPSFDPLRARARAFCIAWTNKRPPNGRNACPEWRARSHARSRGINIASRMRWDVRCAKLASESKPTCWYVPTTALKLGF